MPNSEKSPLENAILFVQLNDLYHIDTSADYTDKSTLILPRISTLVRRLKDHYGSDRVFFCLPGDFLAPSCLSKHFKGKHMVEVLDAMGLDFVTFGNHEFERELSIKDIAARMQESHFTWVSSNFEFEDWQFQDRMTEKEKLSTVALIELSKKTLVCLIGVLEEEKFDLGSAHNLRYWVNSTIKEARKAARGRRAITFVALTHQYLKKDQQLAERCPELTLIMGGHDHNVKARTEAGRLLIVKTASNARTLRLNWMCALPAKVDAKSDKNLVGQVMDQFHIAALAPILCGTKRPSEEEFSQLRNILSLENLGERGQILIPRKVGDERVFTFTVGIDTAHKAFTQLVPPDRVVEERIWHWLGQKIHSPEPIVTAPETLILEDAVVRRNSTNFGNAIADIIRGTPLVSRPSGRNAQIGLINSGSFRIDRNIQRGERITQKTLCDVFYHKNSVKLYKLTGEILTKILRKSLELRNKNKDEGHGNFLQVSGLEIDVSKRNNISVFTVSEFGSRKPIESGRTYTVATTSYVSGKAYSDFFRNSSAPTLDAKILERVESALKLCGQQLFPLLLDGKPRWIWDTTGGTRKSKKQLSQ